ncbi:MAG TPA: subclass B3 metallo-beta-lactamase [Blastocatellia bacterium]|nr:subclass B3 metallo-beta-lactamase [Blastocatellia bacterium]
MKKIILILSLAFSLFLPATADPQDDPQWRAWNQPVKPYRIIGNVWYVGASGVTSFLITTSNGHILLDSGLAETVPQIKQNVAQLGFKLADVKILINSHAHQDHAGGLAELKELTGAKLMATEADAALLERGGKDDFQWGDKYAYKPVKADRVLRDGDQVELGEARLTALLTPGHTKGSTTWTMKVNEEGRQYDVVFATSVSAPGYDLVNNDKYPNIVDDYRRTFQILKSLPCDVSLGAHAEFFSMKEKMARMEKGTKPNPFIDPAGYREYVANGEKEFQKILEEQTQKKSAGQ